MPTLPDFAAPLIVPALVLGIVLAWLGRRGRRIGNHPVCRRCDFDLTGRPPTSTRCPECGADLSSPGAIRIGHRRPVGWALLLGWGLCLVPLMALGLFLWPIFTSPNPDPFKPLWWLRFEAAYASPPEQTAVLNEMLRRLAARSLSRGQIVAIADQALAAQAELKHPWITNWGDVVEAAWAQQQLDEPRWRRYLLQAMGDSFHLDVRPTVARGDPLPMRLNYQSRRTGSGSTIQADPWPWIMISDGKLPAHHITPPDPDDPASPYQWLSVDPGMLDRLSDGPHAIDLTVEVHCGSFTTGGSALVHVPSAFTLLPPQRPSVALLPAQRWRDPLLGAIRVPRVQTTPGGQVRVPIEIGRLPVAVGFDVFLRTSGGEIPLGQIARAAGQPWATFTLGTNLWNLRQPQVQILLRPSRPAAARTIHLDQIYSGDLLLDSIRVIPTQNAPRFQ